VRAQRAPRLLAPFTGLTLTNRLEPPRLGGVRLDSASICGRPVAPDDHFDDPTVTKFGSKGRHLLGLVRVATSIDGEVVRASIPDRRQVFRKFGDERFEAQPVSGAKRCVRSQLGPATLRNAMSMCRARPGNPASGVCRQGIWKHRRRFQLG